MASFFSDENFPLPAVEHLRERGHVVITIQETGKADLALPDRLVLALAIEHDSALLTLNRRHFIRLHREGLKHKGIVVCTFDPDFIALAERIDLAVADLSTLDGQLIRIIRGA